MQLRKMLSNWLVGYFVVGVSLLLLAGCNQRVETRELEYSQANVDLIKQQIEATEW